MVSAWQRKKTLSTGAQHSHWSATQPLERNTHTHTHTKKKKKKKKNKQRVKGKHTGGVERPPVLRGKGGNLVVTADHKSQRGRLARAVRHESRVEIAVLVGQQLRLEPGERNPNAQVWKRRGMTAMKSKRGGSKRELPNIQTLWHRSPYTPYRAPGGRRRRGPRRHWAGRACPWRG